MNIWSIVIPIIVGSILLLAIFLAIIVPKIQQRQQTLIKVIHETIPLQETDPSNNNNSEPSSNGEPTSSSQLISTEPSRWANPTQNIRPEPTYGCPPCPIVSSSSSQSSPSTQSTQSTQSNSDRFSCDYLTGTCTSDPKGDLTTCDACEKRTYFCDANNWSCRDGGFLRDSASQCRRTCYPDLRIRGNYTMQRSDVNANGSGAYCDPDEGGRFRKVGTGSVGNTNVPAFEWEDVSCAGYRCCTSHYCSPTGTGQDPYSTSVCPGFSTETTCGSATDREVPAYCEWTGSACQATTGTTSACAACTSDSQCPGEFGAFKCVSGSCVAQGTPKCDVIHKEYRTDEVVPDHLQKACRQLFNKDTDTSARMCSNVRDGDVCAGSYFDRTCTDRYGKVWVTERTHCGARTAPKYPVPED